MGGRGGWGHSGPNFFSLKWAYQANASSELCEFILIYLSQGKPDWCLLLLSKKLFCMNIDANDWSCEMGQKIFQNYVILFAPGRDDRADVRRLGDNDWSWVVTLDSRWHRYFCPYSLCRQLSLSFWYFSSSAIFFVSPNVPIWSEQNLSPIRFVWV